MKIPVDRYIESIGNTSRAQIAWEKAKEENLDFVNIPLNTDLPMYIDPYSISIKSGEWYEECNNLIVDFFEKYAILYLQKRCRNVAEINIVKGSNNEQ